LATEKKVDIIINAKDNTQKAFASVEKNSKTLGTQAKKLGLAIGGLFAIKKVGDFMADSVKAFGEQERAEKKLESIMTKVNKASEEQIEQMKDQAKQMQKVTTVGDEVVIGLQAQLGTFALSSEAIMTLTESTLDLAVANKGVNVTQEDMINYGNLVGKVMAGNVGSLSRYGVVLSDAQAEQIKMGDEMERASVLAEVLKGNYGDLARDMKETYEGRLQSFKNQWGDMKEMIGEKLMPVLLALLEWGTTTGIPKLIEAGAWLKERWETNFLGIASVLKGAIATIKLAFDGWVLAIELVIQAWDRAVKAFRAFKAEVGREAPQTPSIFNPVGAGDVIDTGSTPVHASKGGIIPAYASNGGIFNSKGSDTIPAMLTAGELVLNRAQQESLASQLGRQPVTVNMYNPNFRDEENADNIIQKLMRVIQQANLGVA